MALFRKSKSPSVTYDPATQRPAVRKSICTGEMTVGFVDIATGRFREYMLARNQAELEAFCREVGIEADKLTTLY